MPQRRPMPDAISLERKLQPGPLPMLSKNLNGGVLDRQPEPSRHHVGVLPDLAGIEDLPATEPPFEARMAEEEEVMQAVLEGRIAPMVDGALAPPVDVPFGGEGPAERYVAGQEG